RVPSPCAGGRGGGPRRLSVGVLSASTSRPGGDRAPGSVAGVPGARGAAFGPCAARGRKGVSAARVLAGLQPPGGVFHVAFIPLRPLATPLPAAPRSPLHRWPVHPRRRRRPDPPALPRDPCHPHPSSLVLNYLRAVPATPHPRRTPP